MYFTQGMKVGKTQESTLADGSNFILLQGFLVHFDYVSCGTKAVFHNEPCCVVFQEACFVFDGVLMLDYVQKLDFLDDILPFL